MGHYLKTMARSAAIETHLQSISNILIVDIKKSWMPEPEEGSHIEIGWCWWYTTSMLQKYLVALPRNQELNPMLPSPSQFSPLHYQIDRCSPGPKWAPIPCATCVSSGRYLIEFLNNPVEVPSNLISFYQELKEGGCLSASERGFAGMYHCKAYIASLLTSSEHDVKNFKEGLDTPDIEGICQIDVVLEIFKASHFFMHHLNLCWFQQQNCDHAIGMSKQ